MDNSFIIKEELAGRPESTCLELENATFDISQNRQNDTSLSRRPVAEEIEQCLKTGLFENAITHAKLGGFPELVPDIVKQEIRYHLAKGQIEDAGLAAERNFLYEEALGLFIQSGSILDSPTDNAEFSQNLRYLRNATEMERLKLPNTHYVMLIDSSLTTNTAYITRSLSSYCLGTEQIAIDVHASPGVIMHELSHSLFATLAPNALIEILDAYQAYEPRYNSLFTNYKSGNSFSWSQSAQGPFQSLEEVLELTPGSFIDVFDEEQGLLRYLKVSNKDYFDSGIVSDQTISLLTEDKFIVLTYTLNEYIARVVGNNRENPSLIADVRFIKVLERHGFFDPVFDDLATGISEALKRTA